MQAVAVSFDPIAFARELAGQSCLEPPKGLMMQSVMDDTIFGGPPTEDMSSALGLTSVCSCTYDVPFLATADAPFWGSGLFYYSADASHGFLLSSSGDPDLAGAVREQAARFIRTGLDTGVPLIENYLPVVSRGTFK